MALAIDPTNPGIVYAGTFGSGVYRSIDGGYNWLPSSQGLANLYIYSLAIDPANPSTLYAGTYKNQIYKSSDGGITWVWSGSGMLDQAIVYSMAIDPYAPATIYAATRGVSNNGNAPWNGVVYKSTDGGQSWRPIKDDIGGTSQQDWAYSITVNPNSPNQVVIATHEHGLYRSNDFGDSWDPINSGIVDYSGRSIAISPLPDYSTTMFYGVWRGSSIYKSINGGTTWKVSNYNLPSQHVYSVALDPQNVKNVYLATFSSGIIKSIDGGATWQYSGLPIDYIYSLVIPTNFPNHLIAGTDGDGVFQSEDAGTNWLSRSGGIQNAMVTATTFSPINSNTIYSSQFGGGVYWSNNHGRSWNWFNKGLSDLLVHELIMDPGNQGVMYALTDIGGLFMYNLKTGTGWVDVSAGLPLATNTQPAYPANHPFATLEMQEAIRGEPEATINIPSYHTSLLKMVYAPSKPQVAYMGTGGSGVFRSDTSGQSWTQTGLANVSINDLLVDPANSNQVYAATFDPNGLLPGSLVISLDGGTTWNPASLPANITNIYALTASPNQAGVIYAGTDQGLYQYQSNTWTPLGISSETVTAIAFDTNRPGLIYAGTTLGAYYSLDSGHTWSVINDNLLGQTVDAINIDPTSHNSVYISTKYHGIFFMLVQF